jgi:cell division protein ZapE
MLMDMFFEAAPAKRKARVHFHEFMLQVHAFIFDWRKLSHAERRKHPAYVHGAADDPIAPAAKHWADKAQLLCFDEFHVNQIADAMILGRLFDQFFDRRVTIVATSNRAPSALYENGINRQLFEPFIRRIETELDVIELKSAQDFRLDRLSAAPVYYAPLGPEADEAMNDAFARLTAGAATAPDMIEVQGRTLPVPRHAAGAARFEFMDLCARPLGAGDYIALTRRYHTLFIDHVPQLDADRRDQAARFVTLIDTLYEARTKLVMSAAAGPDDLYPQGQGSFEFQRTASRLHEMRSADYLAADRSQAGK